MGFGEDPAAVQALGRTVAVKDWAMIRPSRTTKVSVARSYTLSIHGHL